MNPTSPVFLHLNREDISGNKYFKFLLNAILSYFNKCQPPVTLIIYNFRSEEKSLKSYIYFTLAAIAVFGYSWLGEISPPSRNTQYDIQ